MTRKKKNIRSRNNSSKEGTHKKEERREKEVDQEGRKEGWLGKA